MMKKKIISCLMIIIVIVLSYFYAHIDKNSYLYNQNADTSTFYGTGVLQEGEEIRQTFISDEDTIDGINLKVVTTGNIEDVVLYYTILDAESNEVFTTAIVARELDNNKFNQLKVSTINNAKDKQYTLVLSEEHSDAQNGIGFYIEPCSDKGQELSVANRDIEGRLVLRTICHRFDMETFVVLLGVIFFIVTFMKILYKYFK